jgi:hypothetical protein
MALGGCALQGNPLCKRNESSELTGTERAVQFAQLTGKYTTTDIVSCLKKRSPITARPNTEVVGSNPTLGMAVCVYSVFVLSWSRQSPPLWSSGQSSWLQIQSSGFDFRCYQILREVVGLERGPLSLVSTTEELLDRKVAAAV